MRPLWLRAVNLWARPYICSQLPGARVVALDKESLKFDNMRATIKRFNLLTWVKLLKYQTTDSHAQL